VTYLTDFLLARIAEEEAEAQTEFNVGDPTTAGWSPERVLRQCEVNRGLVAEYREAISLPIAPVAVLRIGRLLALPYADHPEWREEWAL
jgi:hypothetical protein